MTSVSRRSLAHLAMSVIFVFSTMPVMPLRAESTEPEAFVNGLVQQALTLIRNKQLGDSAREQQFKTLLDQNFDIPRVSRFVLGRYWIMTDAQDLDAFNGLFEQWVVQIYSSRFKEYKDETVNVTGERPESDTSYVVQSQLIYPDGSSPPIQIDWLVSKEDNGFKILDVEVEGVSMAMTEREEFASIIQRSGGSVASLNQAMQQKLTTGK
jgi:phospholipid transport system substrate-binding protein